MVIENYDNATPKDLVTSFTAQDHLDTGGLDLTTEQVHRDTRTNSCNVISLEVIDDFRNRVQTFLDREDVFVVHGT